MNTSVFCSFQTNLRVIFPPWKAIVDVVGKPEPRICTRVHETVDTSSDCATTCLNSSYVPKLLAASSGQHHIGRTEVDYR